MTAPPFPKALKIYEGGHPMCEILIPACHGAAIDVKEG